ncbi:increased DNA methylation 1-like [Lotus japonicus]|uniref:increased DNA methylation 1-like n=1 Tax=Lotus japonicus TaxID=34305 RepID=UPI002584953A|nr:increased DNA methylation 1-like [Lotus japonicus]
MHKAVFGELAEGAELSYRAHGKKLLVGHKVGNGIRCTCCNTVVSPSRFEAHAGCASRRKPYLQIYTSNMVSLHQLSIDLLKKRSLSTKEHVDLCSLCSNGGDLISCDRDKCTRAFHLKCARLPRIPSGLWYCKYCENETQENKDVDQGRSFLVEHDEGGQCALCGGHDFIKDVFGPRTVMICDQCEKEYHVECLKDHNKQNLEKLPEGKWFCCSDCDHIHNVLVKYVARGEMNLPDSLLSLIEKKPEEKGIESEAGLDIKWRVFNENLVDHNETMSLFSNVDDIFHEQFGPIVNPTTAGDFIEEMLYGKKVKDHDFRGMYCAVLTINQMVVCACLFRVFGQEVAELPLVATRKDYQRKGYFRSLFSCIERMLGCLKVKNFVLPATREAKSLWTTKFGFSRLGREKINNYQKYNNIMAFKGTLFLQKPIPQLQKIQQHSSISRNILSLEAYSCAEMRA